MQRREFWEGQFTGFRTNLPLTIYQVFYHQNWVIFTVQKKNSTGNGEVVIVLWLPVEVVKSLDLWQTVC